MKIALLAMGTRGDVQPYAVLGRALKDCGHQVTLATAKNFESLILSYEISFVPVEADFQAILESDEGKKMMKGNPFVIRKNLNTLIYPLITNSLAEFYRLAKVSDLVLYHIKTLADSFADQFPAKMVRASLLPIVEPTKEFANPSFSGFPIPKFLFKLTYRLSNFSIRLLSKPIGDFRSKFGLNRKYKVPSVRNLYGLSSSFLPVPKDYPQTSIFGGFWYGNSKEELSKSIKDFISQGEPPLLVTFGSMPFKCKFDLYNAIVKLVDQLKIRIIVVKGWGLNATNELDSNARIKVIESAPYDKLFPHVRAIVHHGGIGTTAECLRAGKPFFICPILYPIGDQNFWGQLAYRHGIALDPIPVNKLTESKFMSKIRELLTNTDLRKNAELMKLKIDKEDGIKSTLDEIGKIINGNYC